GGGRAGGGGGRGGRRGRRVGAGGSARRARRGPGSDPPSVWPSIANSAATSARGTIVALVYFAPQKVVRNHENSMLRRLDATRRGAPVSCRTRSSGTPGASSRRRKPSGSTVR